MKIEIRDITPEEAEPYAAALQRTVRPLKEDGWNGTAAYECDGGILGGVYIYDTEEQATEAWNKRDENYDEGAFWYLTAFIGAAARKCRRAGCTNGG